MLYSVIGKSATMLQPHAFVFNPIASCLKIESTIIQKRFYAARRGTRERKLKLLQKRKAQKAGEIKRAELAPISKKKLEQENRVLRRVSDADREIATDNVWFADMFKFREYSFEEAIKAHKEACHPSLSNIPNAKINAYIELDMQLDKKTKFVDRFSAVVPVLHQYEHNENRSILAFCKLREQADMVIDAGATLAGGADIIKSIEKGKTMLPDFQFVIAHPNIVPELVAIRGLLRKVKFPTIENGMLTADLVKTTRNLLTGIQYTCNRDDIERDYGWIDVQIGTLSMDVKHLEDNFMLVLSDVKSRAPKRIREGPFITRCFITAEQSPEKLKILHEKYIPEEEEEEESDDEEPDVVVR